MKPLTTSIYTFPDLINGGYQYVDKTEAIHRLISQYKGQYFLSRPRRFGKSLLISTLKSIFTGQRELFGGLAIDQMDYDWETYPVIQLDMGDAEADGVEEIKTGLWELLDETAEKIGVELSNSLVYSRFRELIQKSARNRPVVILIDEYDKPLLSHLGEESAVDVQTLLKRFYSVIKSTEACQRFVLLTGVSKFSKVSIFSDLNNLTDLTMQQRAATLLGYTQEELETNFPGYIDRLAEACETTREKCLDNLKEWYDGYRFHRSAETVYNPVSVMKCLMQQDFQNYWFETGTPAFLMNLLRERPMDMEDLSLPETGFSTYEPDQLHPLPLLVQTGYLTIDGTRDVMGTRYYDLDYPNREIQHSFNYWLVREMAHLQDPEMGRALRQISEALDAGDAGGMLEHLKIFFSSLPNTITLDYEKYYQSIFFTIFKLIGVAIDVEVSTNRGRIDAVIRTDSDVLVFEFKLHGTAEEAVEQILERGYAEQYQGDSRSVKIIGAAFSSETRNIEDWKIESGFSSC